MTIQYFVKSCQEIDKTREGYAGSKSCSRNIGKFLYPIIIALISALLIIVWFRSGLLYGGGDVGLVYYEPENILGWVKYAWFEITAPGFVYAQTLTSIPFYYFLSLLKAAGLSDVAAQALVWYIALLGSGLSMYFLTRMVTKDIEDGYTAPMISALFYMFNSFTLVQVWHRGTQVLVIFMAFLPLLLMIVIKGFDGGKAFQSAFAISIFMFLYTYSFAATGLVITAWIVVFSYPVFKLFENRSVSQIIFTVKFLGLSVILWLLFNIWWIIPILYSQLTPTTATYTRLISTSISRANLVEVFRLTNDWWFSVDPHLASYPFKEALRQVVPPLAYHVDLLWQPFFLIVSFMIPVIVYLPLFTHQRNRVIIFFSILSLVGAFLTKGRAPPLGELLKTLIAEAPLLIGSRNTYEMFGPIVVLSYSILFGIGIIYLRNLLSKLNVIRLPTNIRQGIKSQRRTNLIWLIFFLFLLTSWPMWTGDVWKSRGLFPGDYQKGITHTPNYEVPHYYLEAADWLSTQGDVRIISAPISLSDSVTLNWTYGYSGLVPYANLLRKPVMESPHGAEYLKEAPVWFNEAIFSVPAWKLMAIFNAKYILINGDLDYKSRNMKSPFKIQEILEKQSNVRFVKKFGKLTFYEINESVYVKKIHATNKFLLTTSFRGAYDIMANDTFIPGKCVVLNSSDIGKLPSENGEQQRSPPVINFEKLDPTRYTVHISNAIGPYFLVFGESYHPCWSATIESESVPEQYHFLGNGYANVWYISKTGSYTIMLELTTQRVFESCALIAVTTFVLCSMYYIVNTVRSRRRTYPKAAPASTY